MLRLAREISRNFLVKTTAFKYQKGMVHYFQFSPTENCLEEASVGDTLMPVKWHL